MKRWLTENRYTPNGSTISIQPLYPRQTPSIDNIIVGCGLAAEIVLIFYTLNYAAIFSGAHRKYNLHGTKSEFQCLIRCSFEHAVEAVVGWWCRSEDALDIVESDVAFH